MIQPYPEGAPNDEDRSSLTVDGSSVTQSVADSRALQAWASETPREVGDDEGSHKHKGSDGSLTSNGPNSSPRPRVSERRERSESCAIEEALLKGGSFLGPKLLCFDGDQTLYSDGANFEQSPKLAKYLYLLLKHGATIAVVTAAGYEYASEKYELRLSGLLAYFKERGLEEEQRSRFYIFGGECNYLLRLGVDYKLNAVREDGPG